MLNINNIKRIYLGVQGENLEQSIAIWVRPWLEEFPGGSITIWHKRNGDSVPSPTGAVFDPETETIVWTPTNVDTYVSGEGVAEFRLTLGSVIKKSRTVITGVSPSVTLAGQPLGSDWQSYIDAVDQIRSATVLAKLAAEDAQAAAEAAKELAEEARDATQAVAGDFQGLTASARELPTGADPTVEVTHSAGGFFNMDFGIPKGDKGDAGDPPTDEQVQNAANAYLEEAITNPDSPPLDRSLSSPACAAPADVTGALRTAMEKNSKVTETEEETADLYIADADGYVIAEFSDGHIKTKNFDSSDVPSQEDIEEIEEMIEETLPEEVDAAVTEKTAKFCRVAQTSGSTASLDVADTQGNVLVRFSGGHIATKEFDSAQLKEHGVEWKFSGTDLLIAFGYNDTIDAVAVLNEGRANGLFDFAKLCSKQKGTPLASLETNDLSVIWNSGTDMHGPFQLLAVDDADGYHADATDPGFTGGNHTLDQMGSDWKTASSKGVEFFADGQKVTTGHGWCNHFEMRWANGIQAYNTAKEGGTGRECLIEYHDMIFDGVRFDEQVRLVPSEDIKMQLWYGLQFVGFGSVYTNVCFRDATNRQTFTSTDSNIKSGNAVTSAILAWGEDDAIEVTVDTNIDLGKRDGNYSGDAGAFVSTSINKGYFNIINKAAKIDMAMNSNWFLRGSFRFFSA